MPLSLPTAWYYVGMNHYRSTLKLYHKRRDATRRQDGCPFCDLSNEKIVQETKHCVVIPNLTKYDLWELHNVEEHLMVVPKRHVETLAELSEEELLDIAKVIAQYEQQGFNVYARGVGFVKRSVKHQHTHLIKVTDAKPKFTVFIRKPYWLFRV
jgi:diadenosine tetraphosphate (Ap4A) HIT family hydrolase